MKKLVLTWRQHAPKAWTLETPAGATVCGEVSEHPRQLAFVLSYNRISKAYHGSMCVPPYAWCKRGSSFASRRAIEREIDKRSIGLFGLDAVTFETRRT